MRKILFVDDESRVLQGLQRMLRSMHNEWDMVFLESGKSALEYLSGNDVDLIVSDMRMPEMDGAELLTKVSELYPAVIRMVLSGQSDKETVLRTVRPAHQYLSKPCDPQVLKETIIRSFALRNILDSDKLKHVISKIDRLPSLPSLYIQIIDELQSSEPSLKKIGEIISRDVVMSAKILHLVNSSFFGVYNHINSPVMAVNLLGLDTIKALVLSVKIFEQFVTRDSQVFMDKLWSHSFFVGTLTRSFAMDGVTDKSLVEDAFLSGMLHDIGKLMLVCSFPNEYAAIIAEVNISGCTFYEAELMHLGTTHAEVGAYLLGLWGFSDPIVEAIAFHHRPRSCPSKLFSPLAVVHAADAISHYLFIHKDAGEDNIDNINNLDIAFLMDLGLLVKLDSWVKKGREMIAD